MNVEQRLKLGMSVSGFFLVLLVTGLWCIAQAEPTTVKTYPITIDSTALVPQSWWQVPGITPTIWTMDPETSDAYRTSEVHQVNLVPGAYKFVSFTFDFPFQVAADGSIDFSSTLEECVGGRGTTTLIVRCKRTYPHGGKPDY